MTGVTAAFGDRTFPGGYSVRRSPFSWGGFPKPLGASSALLRIATNRFADGAGVPLSGKPEGIAGSLGVGSLAPLAPAVVPPKTSSPEGLGKAFRGLPTSKCCPHPNVKRGQT